MKIPIKAEERVTWKAILFLLAPFAAFILILLNGAVVRAENFAKVAQEEARETVVILERKVDANKVAADAGNAEVRKDIQAVYNYLLTKQRQDRLEKHP